MPTLSIERRDLAPQHILFVRLRVARHEIASAIGEGLGKAFPYSQRSGLAIAGRPFTRYSVDRARAVQHRGRHARRDDRRAGKARSRRARFPGGPVAVAMHAGPYDQLTETYAALERWIESNGYRVGGAPWESYITDPADLPDPADWRTEVYWPVREVGQRANVKGQRCFDVTTMLPRMRAS